MLMSLSEEYGEYISEWFIGSGRVSPLGGARTIITRTSSHQPFHSIRIRLYMSVV